MKQKAFSKKAIRHVAIALMLAILLVPIGTSPVAAISVGDYFEISYAFEFSQTEIQGNEVFYATIKGEAICIEDMPIPVSEASLTSRVVAQHRTSGKEETLNPSYTVTIKPFPTKKGDTTEIDKVIPLQFPEESEPGGYDVVGELIEGRVKAVFWIDVTGYLPQFQAAGSVTYIASTINNAPAIPSTPTGPASGYVAIYYSYSTSATDPDGDQIKYTFDWGDGSTSVTVFISSGTTASKSHSWSNSGNYYIRAKATDNKGASSEWSAARMVTISTADNNPPDPPNSPSPADHAIAVSTNTNLSWNGGDPDTGDTVTYDVYFGTSSSPAEVSGSQTEATYNPGILDYNTKYYWRIVATDKHGASTTGLLWDFTTTQLPAEKEMHIADIQMASKSGGAWISNYAYAIATVTIVDARDNPMPQTEVSGHWSGATSGSDSKVTNSQGKATFTSDRIRNAAKGTTLTFTTDDVTKNGWTYNSEVNTETSDSITVNPDSLSDFFRDILYLVRQLIQKVKSILSQVIGC
ncbi:MAG: PKD domain-containing protein [Dehalococcoidia bacterium]|nr:PKD domain-containing protein [Dehalococcoidia bacterium]